MSGCSNLRVLKPDLFDRLVGEREQSGISMPSALAVLRLMMSLDLNGLLVRQASGFGALEDFPCDKLIKRFSTLPWL